MRPTHSLAQAAGVDYVVGGVALNLHGLIRATEDLDIFVRPDSENIARLRRALKAVWDDPDIDQITADDLCGDYPTVRHGPPLRTLYLDIFTRLGEATAFADLEVETKDVQGTKVRLANSNLLDPGPPRSAPAGGACSGSWYGSRRE